MEISGRGTWRILDGNVLKLIAVASMLTDHVGAALFPQLTWMRIVGRIAFPIYCFLLTEGAVYTHNIRRYMGRLGIFAIISEVPFDLALHGRAVDMHYQNVFFTLLIGLAVIYTDRSLRQRLSAGTERYVADFMILVAGCLAAYVLRTDYSWCGVAVIFTFYFFRKYTSAKYLLFAALCAIMGGIEIYAVFAIIPIALYSGRRRRVPGIMKWGFYAFYPVHLAIIAAVRLL